MEVASEIAQKCVYLGMQKGPINNVFNKRELNEKCVDNPELDLSELKKSAKGSTVTLAILKC